MGDGPVFALYDAFTSDAFGGSQAVIVTGAGDFDRAARTVLARELGYPATAFVQAVEDDAITVRFMSTVMELPMCGHGTVALMTRLFEQELIDVAGEGVSRFSLRLPNGTATVDVTMSTDARPQIMLEVDPPSFRDDQVDTARLCHLLGLSPVDLCDDLPAETVVGDFSHLVVPVKDLTHMKRLTPDFAGMIELCNSHDIGTIVAFSRETERQESTVRVRDFCPAVGVPESAAAGTTNAAVSSYLLRHGAISLDRAGRITVVAEQGMEIGRPSRIETAITVMDNAITRLCVGGMATKIAEGTLDARAMRAQGAADRHSCRP